MKFEIKDCVQRGHYYAIVDEVDSILIDEARTPLIISGPRTRPPTNTRARGKSFRARTGRRDRVDRHKRQAALGIQLGEGRST